MLATVLSSVGVIATALLAFFGVRFASKQSKAAATAQVRVAEETLDLDKIKALWARVGELESQVKTLNEREVAQHDALLRHVPWDYMVVSRLRELIQRMVDLDLSIPDYLKTEIPEAPPLTPPRES